VGLKVIANPPDPWSGANVEWIDAPPVAKLEVYEEESKTILTENESPDLGFRFNLNPYRGCFHACAYCYARPSHQYWGFGAGTDFERKIIVRTNAAEKLRETFEKKSWTGDLVAISGNTDCYQPLESCYQLTRACLEVCAEYRNPVSIITKSALVRRDCDVLAKLARDARAFVYCSIAFADDGMARKMEPGAPLPSTRFAAMKALSEAGVPVGVAIAPVIPGLNDSQIGAILSRAKESGATRAFRVLLRLPSEVKDVFIERLNAEFPGYAKKVLNGIREMRGGALYRSEFGKRGVGEGERWDAIDWLFETSCRRLGLNVRTERQMDAELPTTFRRPSERSLFDGD
jgi:DNA repair photolyase